MRSLGDDNLDTRELVLFCAKQWENVLFNSNDDYDVEYDAYNSSYYDQNYTISNTSTSTNETSKCITDEHYGNTYTCEEIYERDLWKCEEWTVVKILIVIMMSGIVANSIVFYVSFKHSSKMSKTTPSTYFILR